MKTANLLLLSVFALFVATGCEKADTDGLWIKFQLKTFDSNTPDHPERTSTAYIYTSDIDCYDFSTHRLYLKEENAFLQGAPGGSFTVFVGKKEIYGGSVYSPVSSYYPSGPVIHSELGSSGKKFMDITVLLPEDGRADPRSDGRIAEALKNYGQYCER